MRTRRLFLVFLALAVVRPVLAGDWPRFRGPNGTGISHDRQVPVKWTDKDVLYRTRLPGSSHSSPIVVGNRVFVLSASQTERYVVCLDATSGTILWTKTVPGRVGKTHRKSSLASSTPCSDGERVYCVFWDGTRVGLFAYDFTGKLVWRQDLGPFASQHGPGFSPIVVEDHVIVNNDQDGKAMLQAFDAKTGKLAWEVDRPAFRTCYSTPFVHEQGAGGKELIVFTTAGFTAHDPASGKELWRYTWRFSTKPLRTVASPIAADGLVFGSAGDGDGSRAMIAVKLGGKGDVSATHQAWELDSGTPYVPTVVAHAGHLFTVTDDGFIVCRESRTGKEVWRQRLGAPVCASPVLIDGKVYVVTEKGDVTVFVASAEGFRPLAKNSVGEAVIASPAVANNRLYLRGTTHLICVGKPDTPADK